MIKMTERVVAYMIEQFKEMPGLTDQARSVVLRFCNNLRQSSILSFFSRLLLARFTMIDAKHQLHYKCQCPSIYHGQPATRSQARPGV